MKKLMLILLVVLLLMLAFAGPAFAQGLAELECAAVLRALSKVPEGSPAATVLGELVEEFCGDLPDPPGE